MELNNNFVDFIQYHADKQGMTREEYSAYYLSENNQAINEGYVEDNINNEILFDSDEHYTISQFLRICKKSPEIKKQKQQNSNFGKGIEMAEMLQKQLSQHKFKCRVYRSEWNYGGNLCVMIRLSGKSYNTEMFSFSSNNSTRQPNYSFAPIFNGTVKKSSGKVEKEWRMGVIHGGYQSISSYDKFLEDVLHVFNDYERVNGQPFNSKDAMKKMEIDVKIKQEWNRKIEPKLDKVYYEAKNFAQKVDRNIIMRLPQLKMSERVVFFKHDEPRELRHPDEYGESAEIKMSSKNYAKYEKAISKVEEICNKFTKKHKLEFIWAASYNN